MLRISRAYETDDSFPHELEAFLASHERDITDLALSQPLMSVRYDVAYGRHIVADALDMYGISYDPHDLDSDRAVTTAAIDFVVSPLKNRRL
jgi:hypothetical protein